MGENTAISWAKQPSGPRTEMPLPADLQVRQLPVATGV